MNNQALTALTALASLCFAAACGDAPQDSPAFNAADSTAGAAGAPLDAVNANELTAIPQGQEQADAGAMSAEQTEQTEQSADAGEGQGSSGETGEAGDTDAGTEPETGTETGTEAGADAGTEPECSSPVAYYVDHDGDGFGGLVSVTACEQPFYTAPRDGELDTGPWVTVAGDCQDDNDEVHPEATGAFEGGYTAVGGGLSWDYNCDGVEVTTFAEFEGCTQVGQQCTGFGWRAVGTRRSLTAEPGSVTDHCGSNQQVSCSIRQSGGCQENLFITTVASCI